GTFEFKINAPRIARKVKPGQFVIIRIDDKGERIPLTVADYSDKEITIVFMVVGYTTEALSKLEEGEELLDVVGPLGNASDIKNFGTVVLVGGGCGVAPIYPQARALKEKGNKVISVIGFRNKDLVFWQDRMNDVSDELIVCTDDGSLGVKGFATEGLRNAIAKNEINRVIVIGPPAMMKATSEVSKKIPTIASINSIMVDGIGMCGSCRVSVDGEIKFACVDGPEFDAHKVDFDELINRNKTYSDEEGIVKGESHRCMG
ncbi:sulfide/dihydroorotate dehydrogenase-like FAD/NAD-binding protein, partial [Candidatus Woesearchaeota archaeon]|nr:sulfide/dihydroorotate dehydrogenase-like FAD/NAD-binding protein [Candidatus Woesearchaeota archaeon]